MKYDPHDLSTDRSARLVEENVAEAMLAVETARVALGSLLPLVVEAGALLVVVEVHQEVREVVVVFEAVERTLKALVFPGTRR